MEVKRDWVREFRIKTLEELQRIATEDPPQDPEGQRALAAELRHLGAEAKGFRAMADIMNCPACGGVASKEAGVVWISPAETLSIRVR